MKPQSLVFALSLAVASTVPAQTQTVTLTSLADRIRIDVGGKPFSNYIFAGAHRPYMYPVLASDGTELNREYPMTEPPGEDHDHVHHRSLWFAHSSVNGIDFWNEGTSGTRPKGSIVHAATVRVEGGGIGLIRMRDNWVGPTGQLVCTDDTEIRIRGDETSRTLDYQVTLQALPGEALLMGDDKDGTMAMRLAQWMTMAHKYLKAELPGNGHIVTATGKTDADAWGKRADWCDYFSTHNGQTYGVAIFDDPRNLRHPTWWMARDYGLFGANPFGQHDYEGLKDRPHAGDYTIPAGGTLTLRYRFYFHLGDPAQAGVAGRYAQFLSEAK